MPRRSGPVAEACAGRGMHTTGIDCYAA
jgi:hypothetical protein